MNFKKITFLLCLTGMFVNISGQIVPFENYTVKQGLPQNFINDIVQDSKGYLWFATQLGVAKFDGKAFKVYNIDNGLGSNYVNSIMTDRKENLWFGTEGGGVTKYDGWKFVTYNDIDGLVSNSINELFEDSQGRIWCSSQRGASVIVDDTIFSFNKSNGLIGNYVTCFYEDENGHVWCGTADGITIFEKDKKRYFNTDKGLSHNIVRDIIGDKEGNIWIATQGGGINKWDGNKFKTISGAYVKNVDIVFKLYCDEKNQIWCGTYENGTFIISDDKVIKHHPLKKMTILDILQDNHDRIWLRTMNEGVIKYENNTFIYYDEENSLVSNAVAVLYEDNNGNIWIGTGSGASKYGRVIFNIYNQKFGLPDNKVLSVYSEKNNKVWSGSYFGIANIQNNQIKSYNENDGLPPYGVLSFFRDNRKILWIGTSAGLVRYQNRSFEMIKDDVWINKEGLPYLTVNEIIGDNNDNLWMATDYGLVKYDYDDFYLMNEENGLVDNNVISLYYHDVRNELWIATLKGLSVYNLKNDTFKNYLVKDGLPHQNCTDIKADRDNHIWVSTYGGICQFEWKANRYVLNTFTKKEGLTSNTIYSLVVDDSHNIWLGHEKGVDKLFPDRKSIEYYGPLDGFTPMENNEGAVTKDGHGNIWFGTIEGLVKYSPNYDITDSVPPKTYITEIRLFGKTEDLIEYADSVDRESHLPVNLNLPYNKNHITFEYIGLHFTQPEKVRYRYKLEGFDSDWSEITNKTSTTYKNLPHGQYRFMVIASNNDGVWNDHPAIYEGLNIIPPIWKRKWFYALEIIIGIMLIYLFSLFRERKLRRDKKILAQKVKERTREIEKQKEAIEIINKELKEQQKQIVAQRDEIKIQRDIATQQRDMIAQQNKEITDSILYAKRIQSAVLPDKYKTHQILPDHFILFKPRDIVSGDFYWMARQNKKSIVVAADCTGHGVPGAFMSMLGVSLLNEIVNKYSNIGADVILNILREDVKRTLSQTGKENETKDGMDLSLCIIDEEKQILEYAGAYNSLYQISGGELTEFKADKMPIGIHAGDEVDFKNHIIELKQGDLYYMFSDGFADQFGGEKGKKFRAKPFKRLLLSIYDKPMKEQKDILDKTIEDWKGDFDQIDDMLVIGFRIT